MSVDAVCSCGRRRKKELRANLPVLVVRVPVKEDGTLNLRTRELALLNRFGRAKDTYGSRSSHSFGAFHSSYGWGGIRMLFSDQVRLSPVTPFLRARDN